MINHIDLSTVLRRTVCDLYSDLVTRPTGAAVRTGIEQQLEEVGDRTLTIIDFSHVGLLDFSCADEIVAKLLLRYTGAAAESRGTPPREAWFVFRGLDDSHLDAIEAVLQRHRLAIVAQLADGSPVLVGNIADDLRQTWQTLSGFGRAGAREVARALGLQAPDAQALLEALCKHRVAMQLEDEFLAVGAAT
ncbi:MAG: hypothetical protein M3068_08690 [Gemmatimonadota bacterium]|nr:hypothetical protein [Gemmatimonadota bacterium]